MQKLIKAKVERFRVQSSRLKNAETAPIKGLQPLYVITPFHPKGEVEYLDLDQYINQFQTVVTFEP